MNTNEIIIKEVERLNVQKSKHIDNGLHSTYNVDEKIITVKRGNMLIEKHIETNLKTKKVNKYEIDISEYYVYEDGKLKELGE